MKKKIFIVLLLPFILLNCRDQEFSKDYIIGTKIYERQEDYAGLIREWKDIGINTAFHFI